MSNMNNSFFGDIKMGIMNLDVDRFCAAILYKVKIGVITGPNAIELLKKYLLGIRK